MKKELLKNTLIIGIGRISTQFMALFLIPLYTMFLSTSEYGLGDLVITYAALALPLLTLSLEQGAFRLLVDARNNDTQKTNIISFVFKVMSLLLLPLTAVVLAVGYFTQLPIIGVALLYIVSAILLNVHLWLARGLGGSVKYSIGSIATGVTSLILSILFVGSLGWGVTGMLTALSIGNLVGMTYLYIALKIGKYIQFRNKDRQTNKELLGYSLPLIPNTISWWLINAADRTIITMMLGISMVGVYAVSVKFPAILIGLFSIFWISWHESASLHIDHKDRNEFFSKVTNTSIVLFGTIGLLILAGLSVAFKYIVGNEFSEAYIYIPILMLGALSHSIITLYGSIYAAKKKTKQILYTTLSAAAINIIVILSLINIIGLYAAAIASVVAYLALAIYRHIDIRKFVTITIDKKRVVLLALLAIPVVALYYINLPYLNILSCLIVALGGLSLNRGIISSVKELIWQKK